MLIQSEKNSYNININKNNVLVLIAGAGKSSRMGCCKALLKINNKTFIEHISTELLNAGFNNVFATLPESPDYYQCLEKINTYSIAYAKNLWPTLGLTGSIKTAFNKMTKNHQALLICPIDMPFLSYKLLNNFINLWQQQESKPTIIIPKTK